MVPMLQSHADLTGRLLQRSVDAGSGTGHVTLCFCPFRVDSGRCGVKAAALAVLDCIFAAAEVAPRTRAPAARGTVAQGTSVPAQAARKQADERLGQEATAETVMTPDGTQPLRPADSQEPIVQARLLVSQYAAGLLIGAAAGRSPAADMTAVDVPDRLDEKLVVLSGAPKAVKQMVARLLGWWLTPSQGRCNACRQQSQLASNSLLQLQAH